MARDVCPSLAPLLLMLPETLRLLRVEAEELLEPYISNILTDSV